jgi:hypothetical protein
MEVKNISRDRLKLTGFGVIARAKWNKKWNNLQPAMNAAARRSPSTIASRVMPDDTKSQALAGRGSLGPLTVAPI